MSKLREAYKGIQHMEQNLTDFDRRMSADPSGSVCCLVRSRLLCGPDVQKSNDEQFARQLDEDEEFSRALPGLINHDHTPVVSQSQEDEAGLD